MSNTYIEDLEKLNKELEGMTEEQIMALFDGIHVTEDDCKKWAGLERFIVSSEPKLYNRIAELEKDAAIHRKAMVGQIHLNRKAWNVVEYLRGQLISNASMLDENPAEYIKAIERNISEIMSRPDDKREGDPK